MSVSQDNEKIKMTDRSITSIFTETEILTLKELSRDKSEMAGTLVEGDSLTWCGRGL